MADETAPERWLRTLRFSGFTAVALGLLILAVVILAPSLRVLVEQQQQISALERSVQQQRDEVAGLEAELTRWSDPAYIEAQARERLLFVYPGEHSYLVVGAPPASAESAAGGTPVSADLQSTRVDWLRALLASAYGAGLTDAPADELAVVGEVQP
jgi:cell division protein FtsB